jgi:hypothetical protein
MPKRLSGDKGKIWINNGLKRLRILESELEDYPGWSKGNGSWKDFGPNKDKSKGYLAKQKKLKLFFVSGLIRKESLVVGGNSMQAEQSRLVWAMDDTEALEKFTAFFTSLNTPNEVYIVLQMTYSEAIQ